MMAAQQTDSRLIDRLPPVRGRLRENFPLSGFSWFRVGGPAEAFVTPRSIAAAVELVHWARDRKIPWQVLLASDRTAVTRLRHGPPPEGLHFVHALQALFP